MEVPLGSPLNSTTAHLAFLACRIKVKVYIVIEWKNFYGIGNIGGYFLLNHKSYSITDYFAYSQAKVHVEVGKEQDDRPGVISIGVIGTASRNYCALQKIDELYEKFLNQPVAEIMAEIKNDEHRLDPFSTSDEENSIRSK